MSAPNEDDFMMSYLNEDAFKSEDERQLKDLARPVAEVKAPVATAGVEEQSSPTATVDNQDEPMAIIAAATDDAEKQKTVPVKINQKEPSSNTADSTLEQAKSSKPLGQLLNEAHLLYAETRHAQSQQITAEEDHQLQVYFKNISNDGRFGSAEHEIEYALVKRMRHFRRNIAKEFSPYADIDLEELLNPSDRLESLIMKSAKSHGLNNVHLEKLIANLSEFIEHENAKIKRLQRLASIIQGDDFHWINSGVDFNDSDTYDPSELAECRQHLQQYLNNDLVVVEKLQDIRDKLTFIHARKREFLKSLRDRFQ